MEYPGFSEEKPFGIIARKSGERRLRLLGVYSDLDELRKDYSRLRNAAIESGLPASHFPVPVQRIQRGEAFVYRRIDNLIEE